MDHGQFQEWLSGIDRLSPAQRGDSEAVLSGGSQASASLAAIEAAVGEDRLCLHCRTPGAVSRGKARGLRRYQCKGCRTTINAATDTPLSGLHCKEGWLAFGDCLSDEQVPVLVAADRSGMTVSASLPAVNAAALRKVIEPVMDGDILLVSDGHRAYPPCAAAMGVRHEALNLSGGERVRDAFHIQTVNSRHSQLKGFLRRYRRISIKYLDNYLQWFQHIELENASSRTCLAAAVDRSCIQFVN